MALSTSEFVAGNLSASPVGGLSGARPISAFAFMSGPGARLVEAWLVTSPDKFRRAFFLLKKHGVGFLLYLCAGISVLTTFLFSLPGLGASCWRVAAGSAGRPECLPCKNTKCIWWVKCLKRDPSFWSWDFWFFLRAMQGAVQDSRP